MALQKDSLQGKSMAEGVRSRATGRSTARESSVSLVSRLADAMRKPGIAKKAVFPKNSPRVYAYSVWAGDLSKIVRVDAKGNEVIGRLVGRHFKPTKAEKAKTA